MMEPLVDEQGRYLAKLQPIPNKRMRTLLIFLSLMKRYLCALARHNKPDGNRREKEHHNIPS